MDIHEITLILGRMEGKLDQVEINTRRNSQDLRELQTFRARTKGAATFGGIVTSALVGALGLYAKIRGFF